MAKSKHKKPRIRLINKFTLVVLTATSLWALWLVAPDKSMLVKLIARSSSPEVSLAFLQQLYIDDPKNREIIKQIVDNYAATGQLNDATELLESILKTTEGNDDWDSIGRYLSLLLEQTYQDQPEQKQQAQAALLALLNKIEYIPEAELARQFADTAISLSMPDKGFDYLYPHQQSGETSYDELVSLALQSEDYDKSLRVQLDAFREFEDLENAQKLFDLMVQSGQSQLSESFFNSYRGPLYNNVDFLAAGIAHSKQVGNLDVVIALSRHLLTIEPTAELYTQTAQIAIAIGELNLAEQLLLEAIAIAPSQYDYVLLHQIYRWQSEIEKAQSVSIKLVSINPSAKNIRAGIDESRALGDLFNEGSFFKKLAAHNHIYPTEYAQWLNALEKGEGTSAAFQSLLALLAKRPNDPELLSHTTRLYSYRSDHRSVIRYGNRLQQRRPLNVTEALRISNAHIMLNQPKLALNTLVNPTEWMKADNDYLEAVSSLAWETNNREISVASQSAMAARASDTLDVYRYINIMSPLDEEKLAQLLTLYGKNSNPELLLAAVRHAVQTKNTKLLAELIEKAKQNPTFDQHVEMLTYQALLAEWEGDPKQAKQLYFAILQLEPTNSSAVGNLIWFALSEGDLETLEQIYRRYKPILATDSDLWLAFASASQQLGLNHEADLWYSQLLLNDNNPEPSILLNYAQLLEQQGNGEKAYQLRRYLLDKQSTELLASPDGDISYRSLVRLFIGEQIASQLIEDNTLDKPTDNNVSELFADLLAQNHGEKILFWHQRTALGRHTIPEWQQLSLALQKKDRVAVEAILAKGINLPKADENVALQLIGKHQEAWQQGQTNIGQMADQNAENQLRRIHVLQHPAKTHSIRAQHSQITHWDIDRTSLDYYSPHYHGNWRLGLDNQRSGSPDQLSNTDIDDEFRLRGRYQYQMSESYWALGIDLADGIGDQRLGLKGEYQFAVDDYLRLGFQFGLNNHIEASELLNIAGQDNLLGFNLAYQPTARESLAFQFNLHDLSTRFGDDIGQGWDLSLRVAEQFFFADPAWQIYADVTMQDVSLSDDPLNGINRWHNEAIPLTSSDFIEDSYQRVGIGQRVWHGEPGQPGATVPSPRYWLDTSLGYNFSSSQVDVTLSAGLGWRIFGNDELYFSTDWQSQDRNGDESLKLTLGYYYGF
ncbi:tetratricopeptide repeat protein [Photobacterium sp. ZSDE20]|uniref:Tetratricopeptide repeat protein n=1 Tax=Photobacterium pectinilyticum TaxID=2906793 RepID=A0ABT1MWT9_9GAMM|nr:tetratricopeptide repeat protein [Photobacterium sp. ZSDE20]MCQ1056961.1 tetratricopeptide repeat protein [Photobacterium sp. ZSDE20]MDD1821096.1 tetratricopeptide repeat protein [Photobacterium sp. ZSDE20]